MNTATVRRWHSYIGLLIAPSVLFFALTGAVQIFNLHEAHGSYTPPPLLEKLSSVHQDQVFAFGGHHTADPHADEERPSRSTQILKWFFLAVALALTVSTLIGIWMGLTQIRARRLAWLLLVAGTVVPVGILLL
ncbi:MAG TPA: hypothetical protein VGV09_04625 [Steroidobacteraceae bacterium]|nr:hypothetical protein [Steroidobacteraceae bacterium]